MLLDRWSIQAVGCGLHCYRVRVQEHGVVRVRDGEPGRPGQQRPESGGGRGARRAGGRGRGVLGRGRGGGLEVELGPGAVEDEGGAVVCTGGVLGGGEGAEPLAGALAGLADLGDPLPPAALADAAVAELAVVGAPLALALPAAAAAAAAARAWAWAVVTAAWAAVGGGGGIIIIAAAAVWVVVFDWVIHFWERKAATEGAGVGGAQPCFGNGIGILFSRFSCLQWVGSGGGGHMGLYL